MNITFAFFLPRVHVTIMVTLPALLNVTTPLLTVATRLLFVLHLKLLLVPAGIVGTRVIVYNGPLVKTTHQDIMVNGWPVEYRLWGGITPDERHNAGLGVYAAKVPLIMGTRQC